MQVQISSPRIEFDGCRKKNVLTETWNSFYKKSWRIENLRKCFSPKSMKSICVISYSHSFEINYQEILTTILKIFNMQLSVLEKDGTEGYDELIQSLNVLH